MPRFEYRAKRGPDDVVDGVLEATNRVAAVAQLNQAALSPIWIRAADDAAAPAAVMPFAPPSHAVRVRGRAVNAFTRQLASLLRSGVPILRGLHTIGEQTEDRRMRAVVVDLERDIRDGHMLSEAMRRYPRVFDSLYVNMVRSGEAGGVLDEILLRLAQAQDDEEELRTKVQSALAYPLLVLVAGTISVFVMLTFFMPRIAKLFGNNVALPWPTRILVALGNAFSHYWIWALVPLVLALVVLRHMLRRDKGRMASHRFLLRLPVAGHLLRDADLSRFARTLALLVRTGVPIHRALELGAGTMRNAVLRAEIGRVSVGTIQQGASLAEGLHKLTHVPLFVANMVAVGEASGHLDDALDEIARYYGRELERAIKLITALLEPALILIVGAIVGFIVFATLLPIFQIGRTLG